MDLIRIKGLEIDCIVGVRPLEREREQRIRIDLALALDLSPAGRSGRIGLTCDYDRIAEEIIALLRFRRYHLIEMATEELAAMLLGVHPPVEWVEIHLDKPAALDGRARAASVEVRRRRSDFPERWLPSTSGGTTVLLETKEAGLYRLVVEPGHEVIPSHARGDKELEWLISGDAWSNGAALEREVPVFREEGDAGSAIVNRGTSPAVLFRCVCPPVLIGS